MRISDWSSDVCSSDLTTACLGSLGEAGRLTVSGTSRVVVVKVPMSRLYASPACRCTVELDSSNVEFRRTADQLGQLADARRTSGALRAGTRIGAGRSVDQT